MHEQAKCVHRWFLSGVPVCFDFQHQSPTVLQAETETPLPACLHGTPKTNGGYIVIDVSPVKLRNSTRSPYTARLALVPGAAVEASLAGGAGGKNPGA